LCLGNRSLPRTTCAHGAQVNDGPFDIDGGFKNCLDSFVADVSLWRCLNGFWAWLQQRHPAPPSVKRETKEDWSS
jgi:hypothetical protein